jgi:hypothetical protein
MQERIEGDMSSTIPYLSGFRGGRAEIEDLRTQEE